MTSLGLRRELALELEKVKAQEEAVEEEIGRFFARLTLGGLASSSSSSSSSSSAVTFDASELSSNVKKIEQFAPCFEAMVEDSKKLVLQVEDCRSLSDRLSVMVRRLDSMQSRAQQALAVTEDIINLKECKVKMQSAIDEGNLPLAVNYLRQVHAIDPQVSSTSDDYTAILAAEQTVKGLVQDDFGKAIQASNLEKVIALCPLLQTLGLEVEARDLFLDFIEATVFVGVSADAASVDDATDPATGYAQSLSNIFNSTYLVLQQYLPMVIQGMERSLGDVYFIKRLHAKCEAEAGLVLKRYMKFRSVKELIASAVAGKATGAASAGLHATLDELALLIQYCCLYSRYLKQLCAGAEGRKRALAESGAPSPVAIFSGPEAFDSMVDELINKYYMEGERCLMLSAARSAFSAASKGGEEDASLGLDECFFVLQRCGLRAVATNNIHAACAVLHFVSDLLGSQLLTRATDLLSSCCLRVAAAAQEHLSKFTRGSGGAGGGMDGGASNISKGLKSAISLASSIAGSGGGAQAGGGTDAADDGDNPYGTALALDSFNLVERCARYTERLARDVAAAGDQVFASASAPASSSSNSVSSSASASASGEAKGGAGAARSRPSASDADKLRLCREDFDAAKMAFNQALRQGAEKLTAAVQGLMKDVLQSALGRQGAHGGLRLELPDDQFEAQPAVALLPRAVTAPFDSLIDACSWGLSETNKDRLVGLLADACCERLEHFVTQSSFGFAGALKLEECVRALSAVFARHSSSPVRARFARLREIMLILTSDASAPSAVLTDSSTLTNSEVQAFLALRVET